MTDDLLLESLKAYVPPPLKAHLSAGISRNEALEVLAHLTSLRYTLSTYLPRYLIDSIVADPRPSQVGGGFRYGTVMFADVSGFTEMSEKLSALGKEGAEEITGIVNAYFEAMLEISTNLGGDLLKFGGDALLIFFEGNDSARRALATGQAMQAAMANFAQVKTSQGVFSLQMSIGMGTGPIFLATLGADRKMEYTVMGRALTHMARAENRAGAGQIVVDDSTRQAVPGAVTFAPLDDDFWMLEHVSLQAVAFDYFTQVLEPPLFVAGTDAADILDQCRAHVTIIEALHPFVPDELLALLIVDPKRPTLPGSHRPVTMMFANFYGIDEIIDVLGPAHEATITEILNTHFVTMNRILTHYGGIVNKVDSYAIGYRIMALFGALQAHEDDPQRAVRAALEMNQALHEVNQRTQEVLARVPGLAGQVGQAPLKQRIGLNTGFVFAGNVGSEARREYSVMGNEVNLTARLMSLAQEGRVLISHSTARHLSDQFVLQESKPVRVKGRSTPVHSQVVVGPREQPLRWTSLVTGPLVGRDNELAQGKAAIDRALAGAGSLLVIDGPSGIGKTRLAEEIMSYGQSIGLDLLDGACLSYGRAMTYHPWAEIMRGYFGIQLIDGQQARIEAVQRQLAALGEAEWAPVVGEVMGLDIPDSRLTADLDARLRRQRLFDLTVKLLQTRAQRRPLMVALEDVHWADPATIDLTSYVARNIAGYPLLLILTHRPEGELPDWAGQPHAINLTLDDLPDEACLKIARGLIGPVALPDSLRDLILSKGAGNPLFVEEVVRALIDAGTFQKDAAGAWQVVQSPETVELPDTIHGVIISRIDRLPEVERQILQVASVVGREFPYSILAGVYPDREPEGDLLARLEYLSGLGLVEPQSRGQNVYRFKHLTTREVIYEGQAFGQRRRMHRRIAEYFERAFAENLTEYIGLLAHHYFEGQLWDKAVEFSLQAARRAQREYANESAVAAYLRTLDAAGRAGSGAEAVQLQAEEALGEVLTLLGRYDEALAHYEAARAMFGAGAAADDDGRRLAELCRKTAEVFEKRSEYEAAFTWLKQGLSYLDEGSPSLDVSQIYLLGAGIYHRQGKNAEAIDWCLMSLSTASEIETRKGRQAMGHACYLLGGIYIRQGDLALAVKFCRESVRIYEGIDDIAGLSQAYINLANAYSEQGDWGRGNDALRKSLAMKRKIGDIFGQGIIANNLAYSYLDRGDWDQAATLFEQSRGIWKQVGSPLLEAVTLSNLAQVHIYRENWPDARACLGRSQAIFAEVQSEDFLPELERRWAELHLKTNEPDRALEHARRSIELAEAGEAPLEEGMSARILGEIHLARGDFAPAEAALQRSLRILEKLNSEFELARTLLSLARLGVEAGPTAENRAQLDRAIKTFERLGAHADLTGALSLQRTLLPPES